MSKPRLLSVVLETANEMLNEYECWKSYQIIRRQWFQLLHTCWKLSNLYFYITILLHFHLKHCLDVPEPKTDPQIKVSVII